MVRKTRLAAAPADEDDPPQDRVLVVGVGASAGGVNALQRFFEALPADGGAAFVVIVHLDPGAHSELPQILAARTRMPVTQVTGTTALKPNCIYVIPPDRQLRISDGEISAAPFDEPRGKRAPIDHFFRSLAEQHGDGFAVILTGAGSDGAVGVKAVKETGGIILVQDPEEAEYPSMPRAAIATDVADFVLPVRTLAERLVELIRVKAQTPSVPKLAQEESVRRILAHVRARTGHDFSHYKKSTITRRLLRRMQLARTETLQAYYKFLRDNGLEAQALLADLLISVTTFFRDHEAFETLAARVIPKLFDEGDIDRPIRVWVAGCASGEEAYSITMLLLEEAGRREPRPEFQVFGTDIDARSLTIAREGLYPTAIEADVSDERLRRFFTREGDHYRVKRELRDAILFASHSVLKDPPFSRLDLISCRNLLIYLDRELQQQVLSTLNYGLNANGYLFLGSSETAEHRDGMFTAIDRDARLFQSTGRQADRLPHLPRLTGLPGDERAIGDHGLPPLPARGAPAAHREALEASAPPSILVDQGHRVINLSETAGRFLQPSAGPLTSDITDLVRQELRFELRSALSRAFERNETVLTGPTSVRFNGAPHRVIMQVRPSPPTGRDPRRAVVVFLEGDPVDAPAALGQRKGPAGAGTVERLRHELELSQNRLRTTREESEAANEELRAANEELQSINEEYRSTAEELETSKEELQSINEELQTVNSELKLKLESVSRANSDLQNLMAAMDFGTLFLDQALRIKRFTPRLADLFSITPNDVGRSITDFAHQLDYDDLAKDAAQVVDDLAPIEREITSRDGGWHLVRFRPYRTVDDKIDGVVVTFFDITERRHMEDALRATEVQSQAWSARQRVLLSELTHRVKNTLTVIQSIVHQTWRTSPSPEEFIERIDGRVAALANAHKLLVDTGWQGADLRAMVEDQLSPYLGDEKARVSVEGETVHLPPEVANPFGLVIHELATNAVKHGSLSDERGKVALSWKMDGADGARMLQFSWKESDGPRVAAPSTHGLGSQLIGKGVPGSRVRHTFHADGVACEIEVPVPAEG